MERAKQMENSEKLVALGLPFETIVSAKNRIIVLVLRLSMWITCG